MQRAATARTGLGIEVETDVLALQMIGKARATWFGPDDRLLRQGGRKKLLCAGNVSVEVFQAQFQLVTIEPLGASTELEALQLLYDQPQTLDLGLGFGECGPFARPIHCKVTDQPMQRINIIRQGSEIDVHPRRVRLLTVHRIEIGIPESISRTFNPL
jgi:hypothetical protein